MKNWYESKTFWTNIIALVAIIIQAHTGFVISPAEQAGILTVINMILRAVTSEPVGFRGKE